MSQPGLAPCDKHCFQLVTVIQKDQCSGQQQNQGKIEKPEFLLIKISDVAKYGGQYFFIKVTVETFTNSKNDRSK